MKTTDRYKVKPENVHSLKDLELEKKRLRLEILKTENHIRSDYHNLLRSFTFRNLAATVLEDITATSGFVSNAFAIGKSLLGKKKKRHREDPEDQEKIVR